MAGDQDGSFSSTTFPAPPPFYKHFTAANLERLKEIREAAADDPLEPTIKPEGQSPSAPRLLDLPPELRYLIPPEPPADGKFHVFGEQKSIDEVLPSLKDMGIEQLYPDPPQPAAAIEGAPSGTQPEWTFDRAVWLKRIARSILLNFLELVGVLAMDPTQYGAKIEALRVLFANAHHLINEYRPHQARESLILKIEEQIERDRKETEGIKRMGEKIEAVLAGLRKEGMEAIASTEESFVKHLDHEETKELQQQLWQGLDEELGQ